MIGSINSPNFAPIQSLSNVQMEASTKEIQFPYNSQDQFVMEPTTTTLPDLTVSKRGPSTSRVDLRGIALQPNDDGNYVFDQKDSYKYTQAASLATVAKTLSTFENACGTKVPWAFGQEKIELYADGGVDLNAYYSRDEQSLNFFHADVNGVRYMTGASGEVVSHEVGHAMLDGLRPEYLESWKSDTNGFHEAFADTIAMLMSTQDDRLCELVAKQTGGDMYKPNALAATGEELGVAINKQMGKNVTGGDYIRNAINDFKWQDPNTVPKNPTGTDPLTTEMHSWSRIWTGAQYDLLSAMVNRNVESGMKMPEAIKAAGQECLELYGGTIKCAPRRDGTYRQLAQSMLQADAQMGGKNHDLIAKAFTNRNILQEGDADAKMNLSAVPRETVTRKVTVTLGDDCGMFSGAQVSGTFERDANSIFASDEARKELAADLKTLIDNGSILYTEPGQKVTTKDLFDKNGNAYIGVVRWTDGNMVIERNKMIS